MKIERLEIAGFKSFCDPVTLEFHPGATAVVGPNGCGKSNIADAVFWVLGELGAGTIRARGKDLIFSGSSARSALGVAEVRLHVSGIAAPTGVVEFGAEPEGEPDREDAGEEAATPPPDEAPDSGDRAVIVTRRVDATGQSTYEMDGRRSTRREIRRLFAGTGLGAGSYALIEQGRTHQVLGAKPEDLRLLIEEAAGLGAYRLNRRESEANLRAAERALERVRERLQELDRQIRQARRDTRAAKRARDSAERVRQFEVAEQAARREALLARIAEGEAPEAELAGERDRRAASFAAFERFVEALRARRDENDTQLREATRRLGDLKGRRAEAGALLVEGERAARMRSEQQVRLGEEERTMEERIRQRAEDRELTIARAGEFPSVLEGLSATVEQRRSARDAARAAEQEKKDALEKAQREQDRLRGAIAASRLASLHHDEHGERLATARLNLRGARQELEGRLEHALKSHSENAAKSEEQSARTSRLATDAEAASETRDRTAQTFAEARSEEAAARQQLETARAELKSLRALVLSREQLGPGASRLLDAAREKGLPVAGAVGEGVEVEGGYERAAERLIGVHQIRLERAADLPGLIEELGGEEADPCEVLVSELLELLSPSIDKEGRESTDGEDDWLRDHVTASDPRLAAAIPDALVQPDLESALQAFRARPGLYVTKSGASVTPPGVVRFGRGGPGEGFLAARREVAELEAQQQAAESRLEAATTALGAAESEAEAAEAALEARREALRTAETASDRARFESERSEATLAEVRERLEELDSEAAIHAEDVRRNQEAGTRAAEALARDEARLREVSEAAATGEEALDAARKEAAACEKAWSEADREWTRESAVADEVRRETEAWEKQAAEDASRLEQIVRDRAALAAEDESWEHRRAAARAEQEAATSGIEEWEAAEKRLAERAEQLRARLEDATSALRLRRSELEAVEARLAAARGEVSEGRTLLQELDREFQRASGRELAEEAKNLPAALRGQTRDELAAGLARLKDQIAALGPVNEIAEARLRELEAERDGPAAHLEDVEASMADGLRALERQDRDARRIFNEGFESVNAGFDAAFRQIFGGGQAELRLVAPKRPAPRQDEGEDGEENGVAADGEAVAAVETNGPETNGEVAPEAETADETPEDPPTHGVEIAAQPPGKKLQSVRLLSGGEKAMTAIAFLIALFRSRPTPFCLLDEVDAPLDDANVQRFAALIGELKQDSQVVVITHNRLTIEACENLYGVTMEEPGVSRLISVQLGDEELEGWIAEAEAEASGQPDQSGLAVH